ncbi:hypothetical protein [Mycolicibacterium vaccae]|uniref:hypothetical protein n=1 Tax=Mycolicibacterium vaccae TaxID=1810 RepID=UPI003D04C8BF
MLDAIAEAETDGFQMSEDLSVVDGREFDPGSAAARAVAAAEHAEYILWRAEQLIATDALVGAQLQLKSVELQGIRFDGEAVSRDDSVRLVDHQTGGEIHQHNADSAGLVAQGKQPKDLDEALSDIAGGPIASPPTPVDQILNQHSGSGKSDRRHTRSPLEAPIVDADPSVLDQQLDRVAAARRNLDAAQAALDDAASQSYTQGAAGGPGRGQTVPQSQAVFDARRELTEQTRILEGLNKAASESGGAPVDVPALPPNTDVQAFPPEPPAFAEGSRALSEGSFGLIPDVAHDLDVFTNWDQYSAADRAGAILDVAGMAPIPGGKFFAEGFEHGLDALHGAARHADDLTTPDVGQIGASAPFGIEDGGALLEASEASGAT